MPVTLEAPAKPERLLRETESYWDGFYSQHNLRHTPSPFALWCLQHHLRPDSRVLELGCGNGRDSFTFLHHGLPVLAVDGSAEAIADNAAHLSVTGTEAEGHFVALNFAKLDRLKRREAAHLVMVNTVYTRFVLHAVPEPLEDRLLDFCAAILPAGGRMLHEFRTLRDPLMQQGEVLSANERMTSHYRRFIDPNALRAKLAARGFTEIYFVESDGLAVFGDEDPVVARIVAEKGA